MNTRHLKTIKINGMKIHLFLPLLIILAVTSALIFYFLSATSLVTANKAIWDYWRGAYDILIRPAGSKSDIEIKENVVEPNFQNQLYGGISFNQYEEIRRIPDIEIAAPVANLGSFHYELFQISVGQSNFTELIAPRIPGIYALVSETTVDEGYHQKEITYRRYAIVLPEDLEKSELINERISIGTGVLPLTPGITIPIAAIDPEAESKMFGLERSIVEGNYLIDNQIIQKKVPVLLNTSIYESYLITQKLERVNLPNEMISIDEIMSKGGATYLDTLPSKELVVTEKRSLQNLYTLLADYLLNENDKLLWNGLLNGNLDKVTYEKETSVPGATQTLTLKVIVTIYDASKRLFNSTGQVPIRAIGIYDIDKIPKPNEINQVPIETYYPPGGTLLYDENRNPVEPKPVLPSVLGDSYFTSPPLMLTTLTAARTIAGNNCISAIRVRVAGIDSYSEESEQKIEAVATAIHEQTGLDVDIVVGSSPRPVLVHIPGVGYVEEMWIQKGVSTDYSEGLSLANKLMLMVFGFVSFLAIFEYSWMDAYNRRREFALSKALGWRTGSLVGYEVGRAALVSLGCALVSCLLALGAALIFKLEIPQPLVFLEAIGIVLVISILGSLAPVLTASRAAPIEVIRDHADRKTVRLLPSTSTLRIALNSLIRSPLQTFLNLAGVALSMALLCYLIIAFDSQRGYLGGTLLGQYLVVKLQPSHFFLTLTGLLMAVAAIAIYIRNRVQLEHQEIAITNAVGWWRKDVRKVYLLQSGIIGLLGGAIGMGLALLVNTALGGSLKFPSPIGWIVLAVGLLLPTLACIVISFLAIRRQIELKAATTSAIFHIGRKS